MTRFSLLHGLRVGKIEPFNDKANSLLGATAAEQ